MSDKEETIEIRGLVLRPETGEAFIAGRSVPLTKTQFRLLRFLASHAGIAYGRKQLVEAVQGADYPATDRSVDSQVMELRRKLGDHGRLIESVRGVGYRFADRES